MKNTLLILCLTSILSANNFLTLTQSTGQDILCPIDKQLKITFSSDSLKIHAYNTTATYTALDRIIFHDKMVSTTNPNIKTFSSNGIKCIYKNGIISYNELTTPATISIYDIRGRNLLSKSIIKKSGNLNIDKLIGLSKGYYIVKIVNKNINSSISLIYE